VVSWAFRLLLGLFLAVFVGIFVGLFLESLTAQKYGNPWFLAVAAALGILCRRAFRAGVFIDGDRVICRRLLGTRVWPIESVRAVHVVPFAGFFVASSLRSVAVGLIDGREYRVALASGRPRRIALQVRLFNAALHASCQSTACRD
jgi:hypothetical protein